ncbi:HD-GYP domain-containing protein [Treponema sp.]|uniref:HD-GYP domain-containing protein n=1 Tax=Treponema sp. TaxID=166 RepID=UPI00298E300A|nr:HD domain-containing phosphohydrolase [Treponema sp.]MCR5614445.1 HD domain-containing protein [Treponema sp.]
MQAVNLTLDGYNIVIGIIILVAIFTSHIDKNSLPKLRKTRIWYHRIALLNILVATTDIFTLVCDGPARPSNLIILPVSMFIFYAFSYLYVPFSGMAIVALLGEQKDRIKSRNFLYFVIVASTVVYAILLILTPFTNLLYEFDENNFYSRGKYFFICLIIQCIMYLAMIFYLIRIRKSINLRKFLTIISFVFFPQVTQIIQLAMPGVSLINTGYSLIFIIMFIFSNSFAEDKLKKATSKLDQIENEVHDKSTEIEKNRLKIIKMQDHTIESLSNLVENRDEDTGEHVLRTREYVELIAVQMMKDGHYPKILTPRYIRLLKRAAPMHDIGKIVVPDAILKKAGRLSPEEFAQMKRHASEGGRIVHQILDGYETPEYIKITADIAVHHHEKWDGTGYPDNLAGKQIPFSARIMAIADVFDALVSPRVYKTPMSYEEAFKLIEEGIGTQFDPDVAREFLKIKEKARAINERYKYN